MKQREKKGNELHHKSPIKKTLLQPTFKKPFTASLPHLSAEIPDEPSLQATSPTSPPVFKSRPSYC